MLKKLLDKIRRVLKIFTKRPVLTSGLGIAVIIIVSVAAFGSNSNNSNYIIAERRNIIEEVNVTGKVQAVQDVDLAFEQTGTIAQVLAEVSDEVRNGQVLVTLRNADIAALLAQARAQVDVEKATLNDLKASSAQNLTSSYNNALNTINYALSRAEDAVRAKPSGLFTGSKNSGFGLTFDSCVGSINARTEDSKLLAELELDKWSKELKALGSSPSNEELDIALVTAERHMQIIQVFTDTLNAALQTKCSTDDESLDTARTNMLTAQSNVISSLEDINDLIQTIALNKISADSTNDIAAQEAKVRAAEASVDKYEADLEKTIIRSPFDGVVTKQEARTGETATMNTPIVSVISTSNFEIEANIPEVEIASIGIGATTEITLDAFGDEELFSAHVVTIDPAETIVSGVPNYKATILFDSEDERIKSGMTANIRIKIGSRENVIAVPIGAIRKSGSSSFVTIIDDSGNGSETAEVQVKTGLIGSDGFVEIVSGLEEGSRVLLVN